MAGRGRGRVLVVGAVGALAGVAALGACSDSEARTCAEESGATFCVRRQGSSGVAPTAEGLLPGSTLTYEITGSDQTGGPYTSEVGPNGVPDRSGTVGFLDATGPVDLAGAEVVFTGTAADGTPVTATLTIGG